MPQEKHRWRKVDPHPTFECASLHVFCQTSRESRQYEMSCRARALARSRFHTIERYSIADYARSQNHYHINCTPKNSYSCASSIANATMPAKWEDIIIIIIISVRTQIVQWIYMYIFVPSPWVRMSVCVLQPLLTARCVSVHEFCFRRRQCCVMVWHVGF